MTTQTCIHCGEAVERDRTWLKFWKHVDSGLYQCGKGAQYGGKQAKTGINLDGASNQFFDQNVRPELIKLETEAMLREMAEAVGNGSRADLLAALAKERDAARAAVRTDLAALEQTARETEQLERMLQDRDDESAE